MCGVTIYRVYAEAVQCRGFHFLLTLVCVVCRLPHRNLQSLPSPTSAHLLNSFSSSGE